VDCAGAELDTAVAVYCVLLRMFHKLLCGYGAVAVKNSVSVGFKMAIFFNIAKLF